MKKISVILTTYNSSQLVGRLITSINRQKGLGTEFEIELIVVDDCSSDDTCEVLRKYDVKWISTGKNSGGPNRGRNIGLQCATGDYICIADHDDEWKAERLATMLPYLDHAPIITCGYTAVNNLSQNEYNVKCTSKSGHRFFERNETFLKKLRRSKTAQNTYLGSLLFISSLREIEFEEHFGMVDYDWILRLFYQNESLEVCEPLYFRHIGQRNLSFNEYYRRVDYYYSLMFVENYEDQYPDEVEESKKKINGSRARYYYLQNNMKRARYYFRKSQLSSVNIIYYLTTFIGSSLIRKRVKIMR